MDNIQSVFAINTELAYIYIINNAIGVDEMINCNFENQFPKLADQVWLFLEAASGDNEGHFATFLPESGFFDKIHCHLNSDGLVCLNCVDTINSIEQFAVLAP